MQELTPGQVFAGYVIQRRLGAGGMGTVYLARHPRLPRLTALKLLDPALTADDVRHRFLREAEQVARLDHPNIVTVYDRGSEDDQLWISMQYIDGDDAATAVRASGTLLAGRAVRILSELAKGLDYAHDNGVLHRDVKPSNILLGRPTRGQDERVVLADFGIAKALEDTHGLTGTGMLLASFPYAAPEQFDPSIRLDARADVYSLGCTFYHLITGSPPYAGTTARQLMRGHLDAPIPRPSQVPAAHDAGLPASFDEVIKDALAKDPTDRPPSCRALATAAQRALDSAAPLQATRATGSSSRPPDARPARTQHTLPRPISGTPAQPSAICVRFTWPLTGRSVEMRIIEAALSASDRSGIVVCGPAGVGKSRIAREALTCAASKGCEIRWAIGTSSARALPLGALAAWAGSAGSDSLQLVRSVIESLTSAVPGTTVVVGVDDAHLLDDMSMFVLHQIVQRGAAKMVLTVRAGETIPAGVQDLCRAGNFDRLDLQPLARDETTMLVSATLGGSLGPDAAQRLWDLTRGNVLYLRNFLEQEVGAGRLVQLHGFWRWIGEPVVPPGLVELIESRIGALPTSVWDVIDALAVGEPIELGSLRRITDAAAVEQADTRGLIALEPVDGAVEVRVAHPLYGEVRRRHAAPTRLRRLRGLVAAELAAADHGNDMRVAVRRAMLSLDSDLEPDPDLLVRAAQAALGLTDLILADRLTDAALRAAGGAEAHFVRAQVLTGLSRGQEAEKVLAGMPTSEFTDTDHGRLAFLRATNMLFPLADPAGAKNFIDDASHTTPPQARSCIDAFLTDYWAAMGKPEAARRSSQNLAWNQLPDFVAGWTAKAIAVASADAGRTTEAIAAAHAGYTRATRSFNAAHTRFLIADAHIYALVLSGRLAEACAAAERLRQQTADLPGVPQLFGAAVSGHAALAAGRLHTAFSLLEPVVTLLTPAGEMLSATGANGFEYRYRLPHTVALAARGLTDEAAAALAALEQSRHPSLRHLDYSLAIARAWVAACQGAVSEAIKTVLSAADTAAANGQFAAEVMCLQTATQFGDSSGAPRLRALEAIVEGPRVGLAARFAAALRDNDGAELAAVSEDFERMGDLVAAVDAAAHAALAYCRQGLRGSALGCSARAEAMADQCEGASTPAHRQSTERLPLDRS